MRVITGREPHPGLFSFSHQRTASSATLAAARSEALLSQGRFDKQLGLSQRQLDLQKKQSEFSQRAMADAITTLLNLPTNAQTKANVEAARQAYYDYLTASPENKAAAYDRAVKLLGESVSAVLEMDGIDTGTQQALQTLLHSIDSGESAGDNGNHISNGDNAVDRARSSQGSSVYTGVDTWKPVTIPNGQILYRGEPNGTDFFTTREAIDSVDANQSELFEGLQVKESVKYGYRSEMWGYMLNQDIEAADALCLANPQFGNGGLEQIFIPNANDLIAAGILIPVDVIHLKG